MSSKPDQAMFSEPYQIRCGCVLLFETSTGALLEKGVFPLRDTTHIGLPKRAFLCQRQAHVTRQRLRYLNTVVETHAGRIWGWRGTQMKHMSHRS